MNKHALLWAGDSSAQSKLQLLISGTCSTMDAQGQIVSQPINNQTLLQQAAAAGGLTDTSGISLAYHLHGNDLGDTIEVINRTKRHHPCHPLRIVLR